MQMYKIAEEMRQFFKVKNGLNMLPAFYPDETIQKKIGMLINECQC